VKCLTTVSEGTEGENDKMQENKECSVHVELRHTKIANENFKTCVQITFYVEVVIVCG
jgi:hypothetical protein